MVRFIGRVSVLTIALGLAAATVAAAQNAPPPPRPTTQEAPRPRQTFRLQIVIGHYDGDRRLSSLPITVVGNTGATVTVNNGIQVPVVNSSAPGTGVSSFTYKNIGFNGTVIVNANDDGRYTLSQFTIEESSVLPDRAGGANPVVTVSGVPSFPDYIVTTSLTMSDGETVQLATAASPLTGQITKIDVTLNILKPATPTSGRE
jgi:hypothetical protein